MINRVYRDDPDRVPVEAVRRAHVSAARVAELGRQIYLVLDPENPHRSEELTRIGREAALLSTAERERLLASVPGMGAEGVREVLRPFVRLDGPVRSTATDSIERAPDLGPFAAGSASWRVESEAPSRARAWRDPIDGDRARELVTRSSVPTALPEPRAEGPAGVPGEGEPTVSDIQRVAGPSQPGTTPAAYVGEPPVAATWLAERETALVAIRADYGAARDQALAAPGVGSPGWQVSAPLIDESGQVSSASGQRFVWLVDPDHPQELVGWSEGDPI